MTTAFELLAKGYFPKELTPPFSTADFANKVLGHIGPIPSAFAKSRRARLCTHNFARTVQSRRVLGIPNPVPQYSLANLIERNWQRISRLHRRSKIGMSYPVVGKDRALVPGDTPLNDIRARLRATARHIVLADISRFYHSIYTHSIAWAIHGKTQAKENRRSKRLLGNRLDRLVGDCQDGQTIGIPVGPDTSLVIAELVASAVDETLQKAHRGLKGMRFIDDFELSSRTRREADEVLEKLHIALSEFELALNPTKTQISDLPIPLDHVWKTPIRTALMRATPKEQATDLVSLFDTAYSLAKQHPDRPVLSYAMGRLVDVKLCPENSELFQRLSLQCIFAEPGATAAVLERLAANHQHGLAVNSAELEELLNDQIIEHAPLNHANEVAWAIWGALIFDIRIGKRATDAVCELSDSVVALTALHANQRGLMDPAFDPAVWRSYLTADNLYGEQWLLSYEANVKRWLTSASGVDHVGGDENFKWLRDLGVEFYDVERATGLGPAGSAATPWLDDLEEVVHRRTDLYGELEEEDEEDLTIPPDAEDLV